MEITIALLLLLLLYLVLLMVAVSVVRMLLLVMCVVKRQNVLPSLCALVTHRYVLLLTTGTFLVMEEPGSVKRDNVQVHMDCFFIYLFIYLFICLFICCYRVSM